MYYNNYRKCIKCGIKYHEEIKEIYCRCGGFLYSIGTLYQPKCKGVAVAPAQLEA